MASESLPTDQDSDIILSLPNGITLRPYRSSDVQSITRYGNNKKVWDNLRNRMPHPYTEADARTWIEFSSSPDNHRASGPWTSETGAQGPLVQAHYAIVIEGEACGSIGVEFNDPAEIYFRNAEIGYWLCEERWGTGIMGVVVPAFVDWVWRTFGVLIRLQAEVSATNIGSKKCLEKAGFREEGRRKWALVKNGVLGDTILLGVLRPGAEDE